MSEQRQEGFWWALARWHAADDPSWKVAEVRNGKLHYGGDWWPLPAAEWGPFIGTGPIEHMVHAASRGASAGLSAVAARAATSAPALRGLTCGGMLHTLELAGVLTHEQVEVLQAGMLAERAPEERAEPQGWKVMETTNTTPSAVGFVACGNAQERCPTCDQPVAGDEDYAKAEAITEEHGHDHAVRHFSGSLCWSRFGQPCQPYDWRGECLRLRADKKAMGDTIDRLRRESSMEWHRERDL